MGYTLSKYNLEESDIFVIVVVSAVALFFFCKYAFNCLKDREKEKKELSKIIDDYKSSKTLLAFMDNHNLLFKKLHTLKYKIYFARKRKNIIKTLETNYQADIKNVNKTWYTNITKAIELRQATYAKIIYENAREFYLGIRIYNNIFNDENKAYSTSIAEKLAVIMAFTEKYCNASNFGTNDKSFDDMSGREFEKYCASLLMASGFKDVKVTKGSGDQGVDVVGFYNNRKTAVQCKRYSKKLGNHSIQEVAAGKVFYGCQDAIVITNNYFTSGAIELAKANNILLWDRDKLMQMVYETDNQWSDLLAKIKIDEE